MTTLFKFQFLNGAIRIAISHFGLPFITLFQFLNGAIRITAINLGAGLTALFQFLNGAIRIRYENGFISSNLHFFIDKNNKKIVEGE